MRFLQVTAAALVSAAIATIASSAAASRLAVLGFQSDDSAPALIDRNAHALTLVGIDGINLTGPGTVSAPNQSDLAQLARSKANGLPAVLLVGNWSNRSNDFSEALAFKTLGNAGAVTATAATIANDVRSAGWDGVSVDLESLAPRDRGGLSAFVAALRSDLPSGTSLTACLEAFTSPSSYAENGYDLHALAASVDQIVLMTYDDHGPWENTPGPIGPLAWQRASVTALEDVVPPSKIFLGIANYGYDWRPHSNDNLDVSQARSLVKHWHAHAQWIATAGEWTAQLRDGTTVWWSDQRSVALRLALARHLGVYGVAIWSLGSGDPIPE